MSGCHGEGKDHCCYQDGKVCPFLEMNTQPGRRWTCGLYRIHGSWDEVHADPRYQELVKPHWERTGTRDCGDFGPLEQQCCWGQYSPADRVAPDTSLPKQGEGVFFDAV